MAKDIESIEVSVNGTRETLNLRDDRVPRIDKAVFNLTRETDGKLSDFGTAVEQAERRTMYVGDSARVLCRAFRLYTGGLIDDKSREIFENWDNSMGNIASLYNKDLTLVSFPAVDLSNVQSMHSTFSNAENLIMVGDLNTSSCKYFSNTFRRCLRLLEAPVIDLSNAKSTSHMFWCCWSLRYVPNYDYSAITDLRAMFDSCPSLTEIGEINSENGENLGHMFSACRRLESIASIDFSSATNIENIFYNCNNLKHLIIKNFGRQEECKIRDAFIGVTSWGSNSALHTGLRESLVLNSFDRAAAGFTPLSFQLEKKTLGKLSSSDIAAITAKGFTITSY